MPIRVFDATRSWVEHLSALRLLGQLTWAFSPPGSSAAKAVDKSGLIAGLERLLHLKH